MDAAELHEYTLVAFYREDGRLVETPPMRAVSDTPQQAARRAFGEDLRLSGRPEQLRAKAWRLNGNNRVEMFLLFHD